MRPKCRPWWFQIYKLKVFVNEILQVSVLPEPSFAFRPLLRFKDTTRDLGTHVGGQFGIHLERKFREISKEKKSEFGTSRTY